MYIQGELSSAPAPPPTSTPCRCSPVWAHKEGSSHCTGGQTEAGEQVPVTQGCNDSEKGGLRVWRPSQDGPRLACVLAGDTAPWPAPSSPSLARRPGTMPSLAAGLRGSLLARAPEKTLLVFDSFLIKVLSSASSVLPCPRSPGACPEQLLSPPPLLPPPQPRPLSQPGLEQSPEPAQNRSAVGERRGVLEGLTG